MIDESKLQHFAREMERRTLLQSPIEVHCEDLMKDFGFEYPFWTDLDSWAAHAKLPFVFNAKDYYSADGHARMIIFTRR
jgi:hypothetical protein